MTATVQIILQRRGVLWIACLIALYYRTSYATDNIDTSGQCDDVATPACHEELRPHYCYLEHNRRLCCRTCRAYRTADSDCPYGDHYARIVRMGADGQNKTYTCDSYIAFYGQHHCAVDSQFRHYCCESCRSSRTG